MTIKCKDANPRKCTRLCPLYRGFWVSPEIRVKLNNKILCLECPKKEIEIESVG